MSQPKSDHISRSSLARMAGNIASGLIADAVRDAREDDGANMLASCEAIATISVELAKAIVRRIERDGEDR